MYLFLARTTWLFRVDESLGGTVMPASQRDRAARREYWPSPRPSPGYHTYGTVTRIVGRCTKLVQLYHCSQNRRQSATLLHVFCMCRLWTRSYSPNPIFHKTSSPKENACNAPVCNEPSLFILDGRSTSSMKRVNHHPMPRPAAY